MLVALTLVPAVSVFAFAFGLMNRNIDKWFSAPVDQIFKTNEEIEAISSQREQQEVRRGDSGLSRGEYSLRRISKRREDLSAESPDHDSGWRQLEAGSVESGIRVRQTSPRSAVQSLAKMQGTLCQAGRKLAWHQRTNGDASRTARDPGAVFPARQDLAALSNEIDQSAGSTTS